MNYQLDLKSSRARRARTRSRIGERGFRLISWLSVVFLLTALIVLISHQNRVGFSLLVLGLAFLMLALWYRGDLRQLTAKSPAASLDNILEPELLAVFGRRQPSSPADLWQIAARPWQGRFVCNHLLIYPESLTSLFQTSSTTMEAVWQRANELRQNSGASQLDAAALTASLLTSHQPAKDYLAKLNLRVEDVIEVFSWSVRLAQALDEKRPYFGGIGRDWVGGFTALLDQFGENLSRYVESGQGHFHTLAHADILDSAVNSLSKQRGLALVGEAGTGKTSAVYALAERLLSGKDPQLEYFQTVKLNSSQIISAAGDELEKVMLALFSEAVHAKNIIIFLDEAELFFGQGTGAFDLSQILLPILENRALKVITAWTPDNFQSLKTKNSALASQFDILNIASPETKTTMKILEDSALTFEAREGLIVSFEAVKEAYRLSDQYMQDQAFPGKAISLLEQSLVYAQNKVVSAESVQLAMEKNRGIKITKAEAPEADALLHLEDKIHSRMINQERAVEVVAAALRRGRAGVGDPKRPIGSFLFLGPTGVGKTELARSLAAAYFGDERQMIRLDMTEYQQTGDIDRLLDAGGEADRSLILKIREQPFSVVLLDEIEKAHQSILNLLLQMLDEGQLTDKGGKPAAFRNAIIIATSNAGSVEISKRVARGDNLASFERPLIEQLINGGQFKAELINRFDEIVLFRPLNMNELTQVAGLMLGEVNKILAKQNVRVQLTPNALAKIVQAGYDPQFGARPMRRVIQEMVEDAVATKILKNEAQPGTELTLDVNDLVERAKA